MLKDKLNSLALGLQGERLAERYLKARGLALVERNYHCSQGEIDLVMREADCLVFVEVRRRSGKQFGSAVESVTRSKQKKLIAAARHYIVARALTEHQALRFDVVGVSKGMGEDTIEWIPNAFYGV